MAPPAHAQGAAVAVGTVYAERQAIAKTAEFVGRIEAINRVEVRARVKGYLEAVLFKEGDLVKEGQPLYRIEKGLFEAAVEQAAGALERAKVALTLAGLQRKRAEELFAKAAGTAVARDQAVAEENQAKGAVMAAEADLRTAKINLGYTRFPDRRQDRPHQSHQRQRGRSGERAVDHNRQPGPDVCDVPSEPTRVPEGSGR